MKRFDLSAFYEELTRLCNNSKVLLWAFGIYGRDKFTVFFWRLYRKRNPII
jgi:hypothetical protein